MLRAGIASAVSVVALATATIAADQAPQRAVRGVVFDDANGDGRRQPGEPGIAGVRVTDLASVAATGADGAFSLVLAADADLVAAEAPDGWVGGRAAWRWLAAGESPAAAIELPLTRREKRASFTFLHASDLHLDAETLPRTERLRALVERLRPDFVVVTGDLVRDALRVPETVARERFELVAAEMAKFSVPVFLCPGNHDLFGIERHRSLVSPDNPLYGERMYRRYLGPNWYSFDWGGVRFVALDSVDFDDLWYYGHYAGPELAWLGRDLADLAPGAPVVTFQHIPIATSIDQLSGYTDEPPAPSLIRIDGKMQYRHVVSNVAPLLALLAPFRYEMSLAGHMHAAESLRLETANGPLRAHQTGAVVGPNEAGGIRFPSGVTLYRVADGRLDDGTFVALDD